MSLVFAAQEKDVVAKAQNVIPRVTVQKLLDENTQLIKTITEYQNAGMVEDASKLQQLLHRNLIYLASATDTQQGVNNTELPEPEAGPLPPFTNEDFPLQEASEEPQSNANEMIKNENILPHTEMPVATAAPSVLQQQLQQGSNPNAQYQGYPQPHANMPPPNVYPQYNQGPPPGSVYSQGPPRVSMYQSTPGAPPVGHPQQQGYAVPQQYAVPSPGYPPQPVYTSNNN